MALNKKSQLFILRMMIGIVVFIAIVIMIQPTKEVIDTAMNDTDFNCSADNLTTANQAACVVTDFSLFYMIGIAISAGMAYMLGKKQVSGVITAIVVFVITTILIEPLKDFIILARDASHLNCAAEGLTVATRLSCLVIDLWLFWFIVTAISVAIAFLFVKKVVLRE